ncbi:MAG: histidine--tRNA ligase [Bacteroidales bacterium]|nr:histidine--tRNA ligase [Bacteroidales bacterium]MBN2758700.1 histidine--tRNA ligase [Bacteroidales bacterium]
MQKPSIPKGTRDFSTDEMLKRDYIFETVKSVFRKYGYLPIETPAMENLSSLLGKYGEEGDKLLFKVLNSGDFLSKTDENILQEKNSIKLTNQISEKGLRYDLTVPFARYVVQHRNDINFPFKRYQIQPVWRADRPQKGRYREFFQCDVDVIGSNSLLNEYELLQIIDEVFIKLDLNIEIKLNNRKILSGIAEFIGHQDKIIDITVAIDKLDKIGLEKVNEELLTKGLPQEAIEKLQPIILLKGTNLEKLAKLKEVLKTSEIGLKGIEEIEQVLDYLNVKQIKADLELDLTLARGLNYYTGAIIEVKSKDVSIGSICGGGRYDDLTGIFGLDDVSGVGVSFGADRIYDVIFQLNKFPENSENSSKVLFLNLGNQEEKYILPILSKIRELQINAEIYPENAKMKKQMAYADKKNIAYVVIIGENEIKENKLTLKNMNSGEQKMLNQNELIDFLGKEFIN